MWIYNNREFTSDDIGDYIGFVYEITNNETGKKYIGKKLFRFKKTIPATKTRKKKRITVESDWPVYCGSCSHLQEDVRTLGLDKFTRVIVRLCKSKTELSYYELKAQMDADVLLYPDRYYNGFVGTRITRRNLLLTK